MNEKIFDGLKKKSGLFKRVFRTQDGKKILEALEQEFCPVDLRGPTPPDTYYRLGARDVVEYIKQMARVNIEEE